MRNSRLPAALAAGLLTTLGVTVVVTAQNGGGGGPDAQFAALSGANEIGNDGQRGAGDPNGRGSFNATIDRRKICYGLAVTNIGNPAQAHIHQGGPNRNGEVVVTLKHPRRGDPGAASRCVRVARSLADDIRERPRRFYVNVHNRRFPGGAVRGQLFASGG